MSVSRVAARRGPSVAAALALSGALAWACTTIDPGPSFIIPDENFDAEFFFCRVEPEVLFARKCGPGDPGLDGANGCHFNASAVSGMPLADHAPVDCAGGRVANRAQIGAGSAAQANLQSASLSMSRDVYASPLYLRATGYSHPRAIFDPSDPVVEVLKEWAQR